MDNSDNGSSKETESTGSAIGTDSETEGNALVLYIECNEKRKR